MQYLKISWTLVYYCAVLLRYCTVLQENSLQDGGRSDGAPDYDPGRAIMGLQIGGQNERGVDFEQDYFELKDGDRNHGEIDFEAVCSFELRDCVRENGKPRSDPSSYFESGDGLRYVQVYDYVDELLKHRYDDEYIM